MVNFMENIYKTAKAAPKKIAFPEAAEEKILQAARQAADAGYCKPYLIGSPAAIRATAQKCDVSLSDMEIIDVADTACRDAAIAEYVKTHTLLSAKSLVRRCEDPLYLALILQANGIVDITFAGMSHATGDVVLAGQVIMGLQEGIAAPSSVGICHIPGFEGSEGEYLAVGDSAVCANPNAEELAGIAIATCDTVKSLTGWKPRCALISFSTDGSAGHPMLEKILEAKRIANERRPDLKIDGEFQLDAAIVPEVAAKKVKRESPVAGQANILIWPDLNVGNVGVKLIQQFGHADAYGPILQGFTGVVCDCSRSAPVSELIGNIAMSVVRA
jgi:phosphate acetyltransferase